MVRMYIPHARHVREVRTHHRTAHAQHPVRHTRDPPTCELIRMLMTALEPARVGVAWRNCRCLTWSSVEGALRRVAGLGAGRGKRVVSPGFSEDGACARECMYDDVPTVDRHASVMCTCVCASAMRGVHRATSGA